VSDPARGHEYPHDLTHLVGKTVKCYLCGKAVPLEEAFSAGSEIAMSLYMHAACFHQAGPKRAAKIFYRQLKGVFLG